MQRNRRTYEVKPDRKVGGWKIVTGRGNCVKRTWTKREAVSAGASRARTAALEFGIEATLRVRNTDGSVSETRSYKVFI